MVAIILVEFALNGVYDNQDNTKGNLLASTIIAVGKLGGVFASFIFHRWWRSKKTSDVSTYRPLFWCVLLGSVSSLLIPVSFYVHTNFDNEYLSLGLCTLGSLLFFSFFAPPRIGFGTLLQGMASKSSNTSIFGFVAALALIIDAGVLTMLALIFEKLSLQNALWTATGTGAFIGLVEVILGPSLVLDPDLLASSEPLLSSSGDS